VKEGAWRKILGAALAMALVMVITVGVLPGHAQTPSDYLLGPGDVLSIGVLGEADLTRTVTVRPDGKITLPLLGDVMVAGMTPTQVTEMLTTGLRKYLRNPVVTVTVTQTRVERTFAYLVGPGISRPGTYEIQPGWTLIEVFAAAGGLAPRAALKRATLTRRGTSQPVALDLERLMVNADPSANMVLKDGDIITIPLVDMRVAVLVRCALLAPMTWPTVPGSSTPFSPPVVRPTALSPIRSASSAGAPTANCRRRSSTSTRSSLQPTRRRTPSCSTRTSSTCRPTTGYVGRTSSHGSRGSA